VVKEEVQREMMRERERCECGERRWGGGDGAGAGSYGDGALIRAPRMHGPT
jgi:hypothetical protein